MAPSPRTHGPEAQTPGRSSEPSASGPPQPPPTTAAGTVTGVDLGPSQRGGRCAQSPRERGQRGAGRAWGSWTPSGASMAVAGPGRLGMGARCLPSARPSAPGSGEPAGPGAPAPPSPVSTCPLWWLTVRGMTRAGLASLCRPSSSPSRKSLDQVARGSPWIPNCKVPGLKEDRKGPTPSRDLLDPIPQTHPCTRPVSRGQVGQEQEGSRRARPWGQMPAGRSPEPRGRCWTQTLLGTETWPQPIPAQGPPNRGPPVRPALAHPSALI